MMGYLIKVRLVKVLKSAHRVRVGPKVARNIIKAAKNSVHLSLSYKMIQLLWLVVKLDKFYFQM